MIERVTRFVSSSDTKANRLGDIFHAFDQYGPAVDVDLVTDESVPSLRVVEIPPPRNGRSPHGLKESQPLPAKKS